MRWRGRWMTLALAGLGLVGLAGAAVGMAAGPSSSLKYHAVAPDVVRQDPTATPTPTPEPQPYAGAVASIYLSSARILGGDLIVTLGTKTSGGKQVFQDPSDPRDIAWYPDYGRPGFRAGNTIFAGHINYVNYGNGPFAYLTSAQAGDALYVTMDNGLQYTYTVKSVDIVPLSDLDMDAVVFPPLDSHTERVTLISCGGDFVPNPSGYGGEYESRVILVAERFIP